MTHTQQVCSRVRTGRIMLHARYDAVENGGVSYAMTVLVFRCTVGCLYRLCVACSYAIWD
ncbi:hypothetical protein M438DRAFT_112986 [Aureobasidium pullulans EXF-150]|uniref:Uncharacterized protein n=1 Tax=Aureobasidium pullulans EXF-150 TaxID=1043002 RepID=A0A074X401_AURPU|nr:uncharacterized protein M438DRAFT_112986 [Aureobasidium pullulans EXF-150]KEQ80225.1 hypothetical protein M438DRAFT_112986 [Aureobasidium pullulans EXF-150]